MPINCLSRPIGPDGVAVVGIDVDDETRCLHYHTDRDVVAIKFRCCGVYYPCFECHAACTDHEPEQWPETRFDDQAVLCGVCGIELSINTYLDSNHECPACGAAFNPGCRHHLEEYFVVDERAGSESESGQ